jgi:hypothetical protein
MIDRRTYPAGDDADSVGDALCAPGSTAKGRPCQQKPQADKQRRWLPQT